MSLNRRTLLGNMAGGLSLSALPAGSALAAHGSDPKRQVVDLVKSIETGAAGPAAAIDPRVYRQHNLSVPDGPAGFKGMIAKVKPGSTKVQTIRVFRDGAYVFAHTQYGAGPAAIAFDVFRFEHGLIVEHWDVVATIPPRGYWKNANGKF